MISELERRRRRRRIELACRTLGRRLVALVLCLGLCLSLLPLTVLRAEASDTTPAATGTEHMVRSSDETPVTGGTPMTNTYMLEVSTGSVRGGGTADNVKYFVIYYTTGTGESARTRSRSLLRKSHRSRNSSARSP